MPEAVATAVREHALDAVEVAVPTPTRSRSGGRRALARFVGSRSNLIGLLILVAVIAIALLATQLAPYDPNDQTLKARLRPPAWAGGSAANVLGTDDLGRDLLSRIIFGTRISLAVGFASVLLATIIGVATGLIAGYAGGRTDAIAMRVVDVFMAFPFILVALAMIAVVGPNLPNMIAVFAATGWMVYARVTRATTLSLREAEFVVAARTIGSPNVRILLFHILPNLVSPIVVLASFQVASMIMAESALSFLGLGVPPPTPTWGSIIADGRGFIQTAWWISTEPGLALAVTVLAVNLVGDGLRDALDIELETEPR